MTLTSSMLAPAQFANLSKTVLKLPATLIPADAVSARPMPNSPASESKTPDSEQTSPTKAVLAAMTRLVEIVAELRSPLGGWPADLPKTAANLVPYVLEEAYDVLDALKELGELASPVPTPENKKDQEKNSFVLPRSPAALIIVDDLMPRLLWHLVSSSYDIMQLVGGVPAEVVREAQILSPQPETSPETGLIRLVVSLSLWNSDHHWAKVHPHRFAIDLATHNVTLESNSTHLETTETTEIGFLNLSADFWRKSPDLRPPISASKLLVKLRQKIASTSPVLAQLMAPQPVEWLAPNQQWLTGFLQLKIDWEFLPQSSENSSQPETDISASESFSPLTLDGQRLIRLAQPAIFQESAKILFSEIETRFLKQIKETQFLEETGFLEATKETKETGFLEGFLEETAKSNLIFQVVKTAYDLVENWEFPWGDGEVLLDEFMQRSLWQTITSSYSVMQLIGSVEARVLRPGEDWKIGILRLLAIFEIQSPNETITVDLSTGQIWEKSQNSKAFSLSLNTVVQCCQSLSLGASPDTELFIQPITVAYLLETLHHQIKLTTPSLQWLINGAEIQVMNAARIWESGWGKLHLELEFTPA